MSRIHITIKCKKRATQTEIEWNRENRNQIQNQKHKLKTDKEILNKNKKEDCHTTSPD